MENIVYFLGAGFSATLGLPVMSNFLEKARDIYFNESEKYAYFKEIEKLITKLSYQKNFIQSNLHNIEEILSLIEMMKRIADMKNNYKIILKMLSNIIHRNRMYNYHPKS